MKLQVNLVLVSCSAPDLWVVERSRSVKNGLNVRAHSTEHAPRISLQRTFYRYHRYHFPMKKALTTCCSTMFNVRQGIEQWRPSNVLGGRKWQVSSPIGEFYRCSAPFTLLHALNDLCSSLTVMNFCFELHCAIWLLTMCTFRCHDIMVAPSGNKDQ